MIDFKTNNEMEILLTARKDQPEVFAALPPAMKMSVGLYESGKERPRPHELTPDEKLKLAGLKKSIAQDVLSPLERTSIALEILEMETK